MKIPAYIVSILLLILISIGLLRAGEPQSPGDLRSEIRRLNEKGQYSKATETAQKALTEAEKEHGPDSTEVAKASQVLSICNVKGEFATKVAERAVTIFQRYPQKYQKDLCISLRYLCQIYVSQKRYSEGIAALDKILALQRKAGGDPTQIKADEQYLNKVKVQLEDFNARKNFPPVIINGIKTLRAPSNITYLVDDPVKEAKKFIAKGGRLQGSGIKLEQEKHSALIVSQGITHLLLTQIGAVIHLPPFRLEPGQRLYEFTFKTDQARLEFRNRHKLTKPIEVTSLVGEKKAYYSAGAIFVELSVWKIGYCCRNTDCKNVLKRKLTEGQCSKCGKPLFLEWFIESGLPKEEKHDRKKYIELNSSLCIKLCRAVESEDIPVIKECLAKGADINYLMS